MRDAGRAGGSDVEPARLPLRQFEQFRQRLHAEPGIGDQRLRHARDDADQADILRHPVGHGRLGVRDDDERAAVDDAERVAVRRRLDRVVRADHAGAARAVLHQHRLAQRVRELRRVEPGDDVVRPARRIGDDRADRPVRPLAALRLGGGRRARRQRRRRRGGAGASCCLSRDGRASGLRSGRRPSRVRRDRSRRAWVAAAIDPRPPAPPEASPPRRSRDALGGRRRASTWPERSRQAPPPRRGRRGGPRRGARPRTARAACPRPRRRRRGRGRRRCRSRNRCRPARGADRPPPRPRG